MPHLQLTAKKGPMLLTTSGQQHSLEMDWESNCFPTSEVFVSRGGQAWSHCDTVARLYPETDSSPNPPKHS